MENLSTLCSTVVAINGFDHKYKYLIKERMTLVAVINGTRLENITFLENMDIKYINLILKDCINYEYIDECSEILYVYEYNSDIYIYHIEYSLYGLSSHGNIIKGNLLTIVYDQLPKILQHLFMPYKQNLTDILSEYDKKIFNLDNEIKYNVKFHCYDKFVGYDEYMVKKYPAELVYINHKELIYRFKYVPYSLLKKELTKITTKRRCVVQGNLSVGNSF